MDLQLLNGLDQIRDAAIFSPNPNLDQDTREAIVQAADSVKRLTAQPSEASEFGKDWEAKLLNTLSNQVGNEITASAELDEKTGKTVLGILNRYVQRGTS